MGTTLGGNDIASTDAYTTSATINNLPINGQAVYVRLYSNPTQFNDYTYTAFTAP